MLPEGKDVESYIRELESAVELLSMEIETLKKKYLSMVRRLGKNRAIVAIARFLVEIIHTMLSRGQEFIDKQKILLLVCLYPVFTDSLSRRPFSPDI